MNQSEWQTQATEWANRKMAHILPMFGVRLGWCGPFFDLLVTTLSVVMQGGRSASRKAQSACPAFRRRVPFRARRNEP